MSLVAAIQRLNARVGIPPTIEQIADADIPEIVQRALAEAHGTYPVPKYMSAADCTAVVQRVAGRAAVTAMDQSAVAQGAKPRSQEI
jgi:alcohol dehydrogenase class IV